MGDPPQQVGSIDIIGAVTEVGVIVVVAAGAPAFVAAGSAEAEGLLNAGERTADVFKFIVDVEAQFAEADDQSKDGDGGDEDQFTRNDKAGFVVEQLSSESLHCGAPG